jgi:hypothetical protein
MEEKPVWVLDNDFGRNSSTGEPGPVESGGGRPGGIGALRCAGGCGGCGACCGFGRDALRLEIS